MRIIHIDMKTMTRAFFVIAIVVGCLIPVDGLAVYFIQPSIRPGQKINPEPLGLSYENTVVSANSFRGAMEKTTVFGREGLQVENIQAGSASGFKLRGIIIIGKSRDAVIEQINVGKSMIVREGDQIGGWKVEEIQSEEVLLTNGDHKTQLRIEDASR